MKKILKYSGCIFILLISIYLCSRITYSVEAQIDVSKTIFRNNLVILLISVVIILIIRQNLIKDYLNEREKLDTIKNNFITNVSHELRTPLNVINSSLQLIKIHLKKGDITVKNPNIIANHKYMVNNTRRLNKLVSNIIDITKLDCGSLTMEKTLINIVQLVEDVVICSISYADVKGVNLIFDTDIEELYSHFDNDMLERIFLNLLSNAIKFTKNKGTIKVLITHTATDVIIRIKDTGIGISEDKLHLIFSQFGQATDTVYNKAEGSGIGLALCQGFVKAHNGALLVKSKINKGSTFTVNLPLDENYYTFKNIHKDLNPRTISEKAKIEYADFYDF